MSATPPYGQYPAGPQGQYQAPGQQSRGPYQPMGSGPPSYGPPGAGYPPAPRRRLRARWFWLPAILVLLAFGVFVAGLLLTVFSASRVDTTVALDGTPATLSVEPNTERSIFAPTGSGTSCDVTDTDTGLPIPTSVPMGEFTRQMGATETRQIATFNSGSGNLSVQCVGEGEHAEVGPVVNGAPFVLSILGTVLLPMVFGFAALVSFIIILVKFLQGRNDPRVPGQR